MVETREIHELGEDGPVTTVQPIKDADGDHRGSVRTRLAVPAHFHDWQPTRTHDSAGMTISGCQTSPRRRSTPTR